MVCVGGRCLVWWCCSGMVWSPNSSAVHRFTWQSLQGQSWVPGETGRVRRWEGPQRHPEGQEQLNLRCPHPKALHPWWTRWPCRAQVSQPDQGHCPTADAGRSLACRKQCLSAEWHKNLSREMFSKSYTDILKHQTLQPFFSVTGGEMSSQGISLRITRESEQKPKLPDAGGYAVWVFAAWACNMVWCLQNGEVLTCKSRFLRVLSLAQCSPGGGFGWAGVHL